MSNSSTVQQVSANLSMAALTRNSSGRKPLICRTLRTARACESKRSRNIMNLVVPQPACHSQTSVHLSSWSMPAPHCISGCSISVVRCSGSVAAMRQWLQCKGGRSVSVVGVYDWLKCRSGHMGTQCVRDCSVSASTACQW